MSKSFCGVNILDISIEDLIGRIKSIDVAEADYLVTPNIDHFQKLETSDSPLLKAYRPAKYIVCDSRVVRLLSVFEKESLSNVIPGSDLTRNILDDEWFKERKLAVIGSSAHEVSHVARVFSLADIVQYSPPMGFIKDSGEIDKCVSFVRDVNPEFLFLAVGCPQQEILASIIHKEISSSATSLKLALCVGASFDFLSGRVKRAPRWMQRAGLEWLFRASSDFRRLGPRYIGNFRWLSRYVLRKLQAKFL